MAETATAFVERLPKGIPTQRNGSCIVQPNDINRLLSLALIGARVVDREAKTVEALARAVKRTPTDAADWVLSAREDIARAVLAALAKEPGT